MQQETKDRIPLWLYPSTIEMIDKTFPQDNCKSRSEFLEKAAEFYCGYISADKAVKFLPLAITSAVSGTVQSSENRMARLLFKLAVEMSMMMNVVAAGADLDDVNLHRLRGKCVDDVKNCIFKRLYEDNVLGRVTNEQFRILSATYTTEQQDLAEKIPKTQADIERREAYVTNVDRFIEKARRYTSISELTPELLRMFISKVVVYEKSEKYSRTAEQKVEIHYAHIGAVA